MPYSSATKSSLLPAVFAICLLTAPAVLNPTASAIHARNRRRSLCVLLRQLVLELLNVNFRNHLGFKFATGICDYIKLLAVDGGSVLQQVLNGDVLGGAAVIPRLHKIFLIAVLTGIIINLTAVPDFINHWLSVLFLHDHAG